MKHTHHIYSLSLLPRTTFPNSPGVFRICVAYDTLCPKLLEQMEEISGGATEEESLFYLKDEPVLTEPHKSMF